MNRDELTLQLQQEYAARREDDLRAYDEKVAAVCERCPGLRRLIDERHAALMQGIRNAMYPNEPKNPRANETLSAKLADYGKKITAKLAEHGLGEDALAPVYVCPLCRDEGYVYAPSRKMCACFETELNRRVLGDLGLQKESTFENYREDCFSDEAIIGKLSQRVQMRLNRGICERYADQYPDTEVRDLLFTGKSGLGKTFLMQAMAHRVAQRGHSVTYISAYNLLDVMRRAYFENNADRLRPLIAAPLLMVDDLGTEPLMENITVTQLFNLLNERQNADRHTVLSTNLSIPELKARYTERVTSRLLDTRRCKIVKFIGGDIRTARPGRTEEDGA